MYFVFVFVKKCKAHAFYILSHSQPSPHVDMWISIAYALSIISKLFVYDPGVIIYILNQYVMTCAVY